MYIKDLRLINFRNYSDQKFEFKPNITVFKGNNGQGKTNLLEAIYLASIGKSHRINEDIHMIKFNELASSITLNFIKNEVPHTLFIKISKESRKLITMDTNRLTQKDLLGTIQIVLFSPEDLQIIKGSPNIRRHFLDLEISQTSKSYYQELLNYQRALKQRNKLLKDNYNNRNISLEEWDFQLAHSASIITRKRIRALEKLSLLAGLMHRKLTAGKENLKLIYYQPYAQDYLKRNYNEENKQAYLVNEEDFYKALKQNEELDRRRMSTSIGPHRDDIIFWTDFGNLKYYGSQGQQRTAALAVKLSELEFIKSEVGEYPILLLDDVLSELDKERRENLINYIRSKIQTFITTSDIHDFIDMKDVSIINLEE